MVSSVVLLSGGVDSTVTLAMTILAEGDADALTVNYGQVHSREIDSARAIAKHYAVSHNIVDVNPVLFRSALTGHCEVPDGRADSVDSTYVPGRNAVLLSLAAARAESIGAKRIVFGANADDAAGFPDCREEYIESFREVLANGTAGKVWLAAPLLRMTKADVLEKAKDLMVPLSKTWSCYRGLESACGSCGACEIAGVLGDVFR